MKKIGYYKNYDHVVYFDDGEILINGNHYGFADSSEDALEWLKNDAYFIDSINEADKSPRIMVRKPILTREKTRVTDRGRGRPPKSEVKTYFLSPEQIEKISRNRKIAGLLIAGFFFYKLFKRGNVRL